MRAVVITKPGGPEVLEWQEVPDPDMGPGDVLINVAAAGVNRADLLQRQGLYPPPPGAPLYPGMECSGRIEAVGTEVTGWQPGDEVCALMAGGGYAEKAAVSAGQVLPVPDPLSVVQAAALPEATCTVYGNVFQLGGLAAGETLPCARRRERDRHRGHPAGQGERRPGDMHRRDGGEAGPLPGPRR